MRMPHEALVSFQRELTEETSRHFELLILLSIICSVAIILSSASYAGRNPFKSKRQEMKVIFFQFAAKITNSRD